MIIEISVVHGHVFLDVSILSDEPTFLEEIEASSCLKLTVFRL